MSDTDEIDDVWRAGLAVAGAEHTPLTDPTERIANRVHRRRRNRRVLQTTAAALVVAVVLAIGVFVHRTDNTKVATSEPTIAARVQVVDGAGGRLQIAFPGRTGGEVPYPRVVLPHGLVTFHVRFDGSHALVITGVPAFHAQGPGTSTVTVRLAPGRYDMHCTIQGHAEAGERATVIVR